MLATIAATFGFATAASADPTRITGGAEQEYSYRAAAAPGTVNDFTAKSC
ncbi:MAG TPA: hypothetical protein VKA88_09280 [Solirubrobacterales bacterium]|nr:hypothetical protein [Solirubrobacterales bacterium]